jgi:hypothetical protein
MANLGTLKANVRPAFETGINVLSNYVGPTFTAIALQNGFTNADAPSTSRNQVGVLTYPDGFVMLTGRLRWTTNTVPGGASAIVGTVPVGSRPTVTVGFPCDNDVLAGAGIVIDSAGIITLYIIQSFATAPLFINLDGCMWYCGTSLTPQTFGSTPANGKLLQGAAGGLGTSLTPQSAAQTIAPAYGSSNVTSWHNQQTGQIFLQGTSTPSAALAVGQTAVTLVGKAPIEGRMICPILARSGSGGEQSINMDRADVNPTGASNACAIIGPINNSLSAGMTIYWNRVTWKADGIVQGTPSNIPPTAFGDMRADANSFTSGNDLYLLSEFWQPLILLNNWVNYGSGYAPAEYCRDGFGRIHLRGLIQDNGGALNAIGTLPTAWRPSVDTDQTVMTSQFAATVVIGKDGSITVSAGRNWGGGVGEWLSLSGITLPA